jgi:tRNA dimethylallyltransferase
MNETLRVLLGPTASGKTAVSLPLAEALGAEIVSVDSRQIYRGLEIGSAAPTPEQRARVRHHLVAEVDPKDVMSAGEFGRRARAAVEEIEGRGRTALLVGGSGLYLRAALGGLDEELPKDEAVRAGIRKRMEQEGVEALYVELARLDPEVAEAISPRDAQRVMRALEIMALTGRPTSELRTKGRRTEVAATIVILDRDNADLKARVRERVLGMVDGGLEAEVQALRDRGIPTDLPAMKSVGFAETVKFLDGRLDPRQWIDEIVRNTWRFVKRQRTWFRSLTDARRLLVAPNEPPETTAERVLRAWKG